MERLPQLGSFTPARALQTALTLLVAGCVAALVGSVQFYVFILLGDFLWVALAAVLLIHFGVRLSSYDLLLVGCGGTLFWAYDFFSLSLPFKWKVIPAFFGLASLAVLAVRTIWASSEERKLLSWALLPSFLFVAAGWMTPPILHLTEGWQPRVFDLYLNAWECSLGIQPSFLMGQAYARWPLLQQIGLIAYLGLPIPISLVYAQQLVRKKEHALPIFLALFYCGPLGAILYNVFPAIGPRQLFLQDFPLHPHPIAAAMQAHLEPIIWAGTRNAMPSLHLAWVLLAWWYSRGTGLWVRAVALFFLVFTAMATLGTGEHFLIDLVVALPFALFVRGVFSFGLHWSDREKLVSCLGGLLGTFAWFCLLRYATHLFWVSALIPWTMAGATLAAVSLQQSRLHRAESAAESACATRTAEPSYASPPTLALDRIS